MHQKSDFLDNAQLAQPIDRYFDGEIDCGEAIPQVKEAKTMTAMSDHFLNSSI